MSALPLVLGHVTVRRHVAADAPALARHANDRDVAAQLRDVFPHPYTQADAEQYIATQLALAVPTNFVIAIDGEACGGIGYTLARDIERVDAEVGYWLGRAHWGRGIMQRVLPAFARAVFALEPGVERLHAVVFSENRASRRVLERAGWAHEGTLRASAIKHGQLRDQELYALLRRDVSAHGAH